MDGDQHDNATYGRVSVKMKIKLVIYKNIEVDIDELMCNLWVHGVSLRRVTMFQNHSKTPSMFGILKEHHSIRSLYKKHQQTIHFFSKVALW